MISVMREKFGPIIIGVIIGLIAFVFVFYGIFTPSMRMEKGSPFAGEVNGDPIPFSEFNRELKRRTEYFQQLFGNQMSEEQMKMFRIKEAVFQDLVNRRLMLQEADRLGMLPSDAEVRAKILEIPQLQKDGRFDKIHYRQVLEANQMTPAGFEKMIRDDLVMEHMRSKFSLFTRVSEAEIRQEFLQNADKRTLKTVLITPEAAQRKVGINPAQIEAFLANPGKVALAQTRFDADKETRFKGKKFEEVKLELVRELLAQENMGAVKQVSDELAAQVLPLLNVAKKTGNDTKIESLLKPFDLKLHVTQPMGRAQFVIPGVGDVKPVLKDAFAAEAPLDLTRSGKAKVYDLPAGKLIAVVVDSQTSDLAKLTAEEQSKIRSQLLSKKENDFFSEWLRKLSAQAKIKTNPDVKGDDAG